MAPEEPTEGPTGGRGDWERREHDVVFETLERALERVRFPTSKHELAVRAGGVNVADEAELPLVAYLQALPDRHFASPQDVTSELEGRWHLVKGLRGVGWESSERGGAPELAGLEEEEEDTMGGEGGE